MRSGDDIDDTVHSIHRCSSDETAGSQPADVMPNEVPLVGGTRYSVPRALDPFVTLLFTAPRDGVFGYTVDGFFSATNDLPGAEPLVTVFAPGAASAIKNPIVDFENLSAILEQPENVEAVPEDYLAWFSQRPGVTAGPITDVEFAGIPARGMTYQIGSVPGALRCAPDDPRSCLAWLYFQGGVVTAGVEGDAGTLYELTVDGRR